MLQQGNPTKDLPSRFLTEKLSSQFSIGAVRTSFGVKGWLKLVSFSGEWKHFKVLSSVVLADTHRNNPENYDIEGFQIHHGNGIMKLSRVDDLESARALAGQILFVSREFAVPLEADEWYVRDLIGLSVIDNDCNYIGEIVSMIKTSDDLLVISRTDKSQFMVPFRKQFVGEPDFASCSIVLEAKWLADL